MKRLYQTQIITNRDDLKPGEIAFGLVKINSDGVGPVLDECVSYPPPKGEVGIPELEQQDGEIVARFVVDGELVATVRAELDA